MKDHHSRSGRDKSSWQRFRGAVRKRRLTHKSVRLRGRGLRLMQRLIREAWKRELRYMAHLAFSDQAHGADLSDIAATLAKTSRMRLWIAQSNELVEEIKGSARLKRRRRRGILRHLSGLDLGFSVFLPDLELYRTPDSPEPRTFKLLDELEWVVIPGYTGPNGWRPTKDELTFDEARAIGGMKASTLYAHTAQRNVPGLIIRTLGDDLECTVHELRFKTDEFMAWAVVVTIRTPKKPKK